MRNADRLRSFLVRLPLTMIVGMVLWLLLRPLLDHAVAGLAEVVVRAFEHPKVTRLLVEAHVVNIARTDLLAGSAIPSFPLTQVHFNTIVLLALFLALPRPFSRRQLERLLMGGTLLFALQTLNLILHVKMTYATMLGAWSTQHYSGFARNFYGFWQYFTDLPARFSAPFLIWLGFNWDHLIGLVQSGKVADRAGQRNRQRRRK